MSKNDTIVAQATPPGRGGIGILRISGNQTSEIAKAILGKLPKPRYANYLPFMDINGTVLDYGIALWFPKPNSFTGEDVLELQGHGGQIVLDMLLKRILTIPGIRIAQPGEFSERAFLNEKLDLTQAEAIADLINANSEQAAKAALNSLRGEFSLRINKLLEDLTYLRTYVETTIDFSNDDINFISNDKIKTQLNIIIHDLNHIRSETNQGILISEGIKVVITGHPNAGKSSLINKLSGYEVAIVTDIAGTTRDVIREHIYIDGIPLHIIDTAGLRKTKDKLESIGIERAWKEIKNADHILFMIDSTTVSITNSSILPNFIKDLSIKIPTTIIRNKIDITGEKFGLIEVNNVSIICLSILTGEGISTLRSHLKKSISLDSRNSMESNFLARRRHLQALDIAAKYLQSAKEQTIHFWSIELIAEDLRLAQKTLNEITGKFTSNDLLNRIFSNFCIGK
ncbi:tRNA uridine-5-carboxymethylaminomethyl(34) synthesis GTPase MnmE [Pantoea sp. Aalb]|uniref:tRNA uridine-5-carboxymethylaminomethyl(34) synthesis GTPase MnmE n=1 Tax=Pantoea sp. Aalb TaxID=2576762 RepID=UPI001324BADF|nr:tRNA uridine-5-carboxymethylaminomethyl(34) synthesis GTPase MnmE [Pantoea sp. Aalb]MXP67628.1 tRNA uridine-5-carboxymethylaminomethyl(34) synthesis GTPase MnmE [Pantoea sp. Aalb]